MSTERAAGLSASCLVAGGAAFGIIHHVAGDNGPESPLASVAFGLPLLAAGAVALLAVRSGRPLLWISAGAAAFPMALVSVVGLPVVVPALVLVALGATGAVRPSRLETALAAAIPAALVGVFALLVFHQDPVRWSTPTASGSSSNIITGTEIVATLVVVALVLAATVATPRRLSAEAPGGA